MRYSIKPMFAVMAALALGACSDVESDLLAPDDLQISEARSSKASPAKGESSIAQIALDFNAGDPAEFTELVAALLYVDMPLDEGGQNAGLVDLFLNGTDQFTVFAPTDEAFGGLYELLSAVLTAEIDEITDIPSGIVLDVLAYHVVEGRRAANSVVPKNRDRTITSLLGETFAVRSNGSIEDGLTGLRDDALIDMPNVSASNGIIHGITQVIVPPSVVATLTGG